MSKSCQLAFAASQRSFWGRNLPGLSQVKAPNSFFILILNDMTVGQGYTWPNPLCPVLMPYFLSSKPDPSSPTLVH